MEREQGSYLGAGFLPGGGVPTWRGLIPEDLVPT